MADQKFKEIGTSGLEFTAGWVSEAYNSALHWPGCVEMYNRIWRSDPEIAISRRVIEAFASKLDVQFEVPDRGDEQPSDDDKKAAEFGNQVLADLEGGIDGWLSSCMSRVLFYGWGWWETPAGIRSEKWQAPGGDPWRSDFNDGLIGFRRLAFRHYKSFWSWDIDDYSGRLNGMIQHDPPNRMVTIPLNRSLHIKVGDTDNPEGLATMESLWRLERLKYGLEVVFGIGAEHTAGYLSVSSENTLTPQDQTAIKQAARAIMTAQEGNYAAWPKNIKGELIDVSFSAGQTVLDAIRYYGILKLALLNMQWIALGTMSPYGSYSSISDASQFFVTWFNAAAQAIVRQADEQIGRRLFDFEVNRAAFPGMTRRPELRVTPIAKEIPLTELGQFATAIKSVIPLGTDDHIALRKKSEILPEVPPDDAEMPEPAVPFGQQDQPPAEDGDGEKPQAEDGDADESVDEDGGAEMSLQGEQYSDGVMIAFRVPGDLAGRLALADGLTADDLHITLAYLGEANALGDQVRAAAQWAIMTIADTYRPLRGSIGGFGVFVAQAGRVFYAQPDVRGIQELRADLVRSLKSEGIDVASEYSYTPHVTLKYLNDGEMLPDTQIPMDEFELSEIALVWGTEVEFYPLNGGKRAELARRPFVVDGDERAIDVSYVADDPAAGLGAVIKSFRRWAEENAPAMADILDAEVLEDDNES